MLTQARLKEILSYDPETGVFRWLVKPHQRARIGDVAGSYCKGYISVRLDGKRYMAHRLAFLFIEGSMPPNSVDHRNGIRKDNRWANLRHATHRLNLQNQRRAHSDNTHGFLGVSSARKRFRAQLNHLGKIILLGNFDTPEQAHEAYLVAKRVFHPGCTI